MCVILKKEMENFFFHRAKKIGSVLMIIGIILLPFLMFLYTMVYLMSDWPPLGPMEHTVVLTSFFGGILNILSVIISFFKKTFKAGIFGSIFFSFLFIVVGAYFFLSESDFGLWIISSSIPILIILGALLRIFKNEKALKIVYWIIFLALLIFIGAIIGFFISGEYRELILLKRLEISWVGEWADLG
ncbi:MAG: hypothetical protein COY10_00405 [Candidatus Portnoybacteria bacterium CG_4_10_14_0_2_um_filter_43_36]|uniref:Uncharacterized protein n=1 Tax=Candidatus Portnoybacteria bacterium CG_4_10_14_0_2_um_filter_43_36 TaxID=1974798 RepID=A0A2M7UFQ5_9BACT|nr:MAG: hypothetical protein COY10_00405 [Candidatus Portnoybacteria bacterium CG_4_10_14_0_2_um_filter_43_36]